MARAQTPFDPSVFDLDMNLTINMNRKHGRIWLDLIYEGFFVDMPVAEFVRWCQKYGTKLMTYMPGYIYQPDFRDAPRGSCSGRPGWWKRT